MLFIQEDGVLTEVASPNPGLNDIDVQSPLPSIQCAYFVSKGAMRVSRFTTAALKYSSNSS